jgi:proteic killer suppression protein
MHVRRASHGVARPLNCGARRHDHAVAARHVTRYNPSVIKTFADRRTQELYATGKGKRIPADVAKRAARKLEYVDLATSVDDLRVPPGNRLHALTGDRKGQHSISVNDQWRICFRLVDGDAYDVEFCDYH